MNAVAERREQFDRGEERRGEATTTFNLADCGRPKRMRDVARRKQEYKGWMSNGGRKGGRKGWGDRKRRGELERREAAPAKTWRRQTRKGGDGRGGSIPHYIVLWESKRTGVSEDRDRNHPHTRAHAPAVSQSTDSLPRGAFYWQGRRRRREEDK